MLSYIVAGLALGAIYAIATSGLMITFISTGVLNLAFASMAYVVARGYYWMNTQHDLSTINAGLISLLVVAPIMGVVLYAAVFRHLTTRSTLVKLVATIGVSVALPAISDLVFGIQLIPSAPGLALQSDAPFHFLGTVITTNQVVIYGFVVFVLVGGTLILRYTDAGLRIRAMVDSEALTSLSGVNPGRVLLGVWIISAMLAGLAGILVAPINGLSSGGMTIMMSSAFAAVVVARFRSLPGAVLVCFGLGVATDVAQEYLPTNSTLTAAFLSSIPYMVMFVFLVYYVVTSGHVSNDAGVGAGGPLDKAIRPVSQDPTAPVAGQVSRTKWETAFGAVPIAVVVLLPLIFHASSFWLALTVTGICYGITFLTFTLVTGEGGMLWLSQIIFAGGGALATAQFSSVWHIPVLLAIFMGGLLAAVVGAIVGLLTIKLGELYVALVTLTFGLLVENLVFTMNQFQNGGAGVAVNRPDFAQSDLRFAYLALAVFLIFAILTWNLFRSTTGMALRAVRDSRAAASAIGLNAVQVKVMVGAIGAFVAAIGGGFLAVDQLSAVPASYDIFAGLVWLAVVVTMGIRSISAALLAGLAIALIPGLFANYLPVRWAEVPTVMFGLGALAVALHPEGAVVQNGQHIRGLIFKTVRRWRQSNQHVAMGQFTTAQVDEP